jgi:predicted O-methyltransferase YrrM
MLSRPEAIFLHQTPARIGNGLYADLGTHRGRSAVLMAGGMKDNNIDGHIITVDSYDGRGVGKRFLKGPLTGEVTQRYPTTIDTVKAILEAKGVRSYVTPVHGLTADTAADYQDKEFVFVFIDAGHTYKDCKADFEAWSPLVKSGGEVAFHDANGEEVNRVVEEAGWERYDIETIAVLRKP